MAKKNIYSSFRLDKVEDIDVLKRLIEEHGQFFYKDYVRFCKQVRNSKYRTRLLRKLDHVILPLIGYVAPSEFSAKNDRCGNSILRNGQVDVEKQDIFSIPHKASDFTIHEGYIQIDKYILKSVRISKTHPSWLEEIEHVFHIARDTQHADRFHFVPYTDLSFLLDKIDAEVEEDNIDDEWNNIMENWPADFYSFLRPLNFESYRSITSNDRFNLKDLIDAEKELSKISNIRASLIVPMCDVTLNEGSVVIDVSHAKFIEEEGNLPFHNLGCTDVTWRSYLDYVRYDIPDKYLNSYKSLFDEEKQRVLDKIRCQGKLKFETYLSKDSFLTLFKDYEWMPCACNDKLEVEWYIFNYITRYNLWKLVAKDYKFSSRTLKNFENYKKQHNNLPVHSMTIQVNPYYVVYKSSRIINLRVVKDMYFFSKIKHPYMELSKHSIVTVFFENTNHYSDLVGGTSHKTYMVWSKDSNVISLYPTEKKYANYKFYVSTENHTLEEAACAIYDYFTSVVNNKRQGFCLTDSFKDFGIYLFRRF